MPALHHVQLAMPTGRETEARAFYTDVLGLAEIDKPPELAARGGAWFRSGGLELHLGVEAPFAPARKAHPGILLDDVAELEALAARLTDAGTPVQPDDAFRASVASTCTTASATVSSSCLPQAADQSFGRRRSRRPELLTRAPADPPTLVHRTRTRTRTGVVADG